MDTPKLQGVAAAYAEALAALNEQSVALATISQPPPVEAAVKSSEDFAAAMTDPLASADAELAAAAIYADVQLVARLSQYVPLNGADQLAITGGFIDDLREAVEKIRALIAGAPDPSPSGKQLTDDLQPSYTAIVTKTANSLDSDLGDLGITSLMDVLTKVEELPDIGALVSDVHKWIARVLTSAVDKLVRLVGQTTTSQVVELVTNWLGKHFDVQTVTVEMLTDAFRVEGSVEALQRDLAQHKLSQSTNDKAVVAVDALVASNGRIVDALDATVTAVEDVIGFASDTPLKAYAAIAKITIPALAALAALLIAIDDLDAWGDDSNTPVLDTPGIPLLVNAAIALSQ
jgi:hypothetical protein